MKFWIAFSFTDTRHLVTLSRRAEALGFEGVFLADHLCVPSRIESPYPYDPDGTPPVSPRVEHPDVWAAISAMATATRTLRFSIGTHILPLHDPLEVARGAATASVLSNGRAHLSVGAGWMREEFDIQGIDFKTRGRRMDEMIEVMRKVWTGDAVEHHGTHFDFPSLTMRPAPDDLIPILIAGLSPRALRRTAELGDGWIGPGNTPDEAETILLEIHCLREEAGRSHLPFECIVPLTSEPNADVYERLGALGMDASVSWPASLAMGIEAPTLEQELEYLESFAKTVIEPFA